MYDLTNLKSSENLHKWLAEILNKDNNSKYKCTDGFDMEQLVGSNKVMNIQHLNIIFINCKYVSFSNSLYSIKYNVLYVCKQLNYIYILNNCEIFFLKYCTQSILI